MGEVEVRVPIRVRLVGTPTAGDLADLEAAVARLVGSRLARAHRELATPMTTSAMTKTETPIEAYEPGRVTGEGYRLMSYQGPPRQVRVPVTPPAEERVRPILRRISDLLGTGLFDWAVTDSEAREALRILRGLAPEDLFRVVQSMRLSGRMATLGRELPADADDDLVDLQQRMDPDLGHLMPGDTIRIETRAGAKVDRDTSGDRVIGDDGRIDLPLAGRTPVVTGLFPADLPDLIARAYVDGLFLISPSVRVAVIARGPRYAPRHGPTGGAMWFTSKPIARPATDWTRLEERVIPQEVPVSVRGRFLDLAAAMQRSVAVAPPDERLRLSAALGDYLAWLDRQSDADLARRDPGQVWSRLYVMRFDADVKARAAERLRHDRMAAVDEAERVDRPAAERKLDEALELLKRQMWKPREPYTVEDRESGVGYLVWQSAREKAVRDLIARSFLRDVIAGMHRKDFTATSAAADFRDWLLRHPAEYQALLLAAAYPDVEKYAVEIDIPAWQTAIEVAIGFIPIVGSIVAAGEAAFGYDLFGNKLSTVDRAILGASVLLPAAGRVFKAGRAAVTVSALARDYRLSAREADAAYRALTQIRPGTANAQLLQSASAEIRAGGSIRDAKRLGEMQTLLKDMGFTDHATAGQLRAGAADSALAGRAGRTGQEAADLFASSDEVAGAVGAAERDATRPVVKGGQKPVIDDVRIPTRQRNRLDQAHLARLAGETERQAVARVRQVIGRRIDETPLGPVWERARARVVGGRSLENATKQQMIDLYGEVRNEFWDLARADPDAARFLAGAGFEFPVTGRAPLLRVADPPPGLGLPRAADLGVQERRISLDHNLEKAIGENWRRAIDADNLTFEIHNPNSNRETVQVKFGLRLPPPENPE